MKTGIIEFILSNVGSKSEKMQPFLKEEDGNLVEVFKEGDNPFNNDTLKEYEGKKVTITGEENEYGLFVIDTINVVEEKTAVENETKPVAVPKSVVEEAPAENEVSAEAEEKTEEKAEESPATKEIPLKGFKKFLALFHRK